jgi:hypothetical protein
MAEELLKTRAAGSSAMLVMCLSNYTALHPRRPYIIFM